MQLIAVIVVLFVTVAFVVRWVVRTMRSENPCCGCSDCPKTGSQKCHCCENAAKLPEVNVDE